MRTNMSPMTLILAVTSELGYANENIGMPWPHYKEDMKRFQKCTKGKPCVMGRNTYEEMIQLQKSRNGNKDITDLLPGRKCFVISSNKDLELEGGATLVHSLIEAVQSLPVEDSNVEIMILGGLRLWTEATAWADKLELTIVHNNDDYNCTHFIPKQLLAAFKTEIKVQQVKDDDKMLLFLTLAK